MVPLEFLLLGGFGGVMYVMGYFWLVTYARSFSDNPKATLSADMLLALLSGPAIVPVVMCLITLLAGVWILALALYISLQFARFSVFG